MKNRVFLSVLFAAIFAVALFVAPQANAAIHTIDFTGSVTSFATNPWGIDGASAVSGSATYDTDLIDGIGSLLIGDTGGSLSFSVGPLSVDETQDIGFAFGYPEIGFETPLGNPEVLNYISFLGDFAYDNVNYAFDVWQAGSDILFGIYVPVTGAQVEFLVSGVFNLPVSWQDSGTPSAVPIPGAVWLLGSGLVGLAGLRRKMKS